jgi:hypothetical protein
MRAEIAAPGHARAATAVSSGRVRGKPASGVAVLPCA